MIPHLRSEDIIEDQKKDRDEFLEVNRAITEGLEGEEDSQVKFTAREKSIDDSSSVKVHDYQKIVKEIQL